MQFSFLLVASALAAPISFKPLADKFNGLGKWGKAGVIAGTAGTTVALGAGGYYGVKKLSEHRAEKKAEKAAAQAAAQTAAASTTTTTEKVVEEKVL